jgi:hypothetical protein
VKARACGHRTLALPWRKVEKQQFTDIHPVQQLGFRGPWVCAQMVRDFEARIAAKRTMRTHLWSGFGYCRA